MQPFNALELVLGVLIYRGYRELRAALGRDPEYDASRPDPRVLAWHLSRSGHMAARERADGEIVA